MSYSVRGRTNVGAYERPFSGVGIGYYPLGVKPGRSGITLHESGYLPENAQWNYPNTFSPFYRLVYNSKPGHCVIFGERRIELTPEHIMLIRPHCLFHNQGDPPVPHVWFLFSFTKKLHPSQTPALLVPRDTELCLIRDIKALIDDDPEWEATDAIYRNSLALLQVVLARPELRWQPPVPNNLTQAVKHIEGHIGEKLPNPALAQIAGMSVEGFGKAFQRHFETTPARFVAETRVSEACRLLFQTDETIEDIAEKTGFPNRAYLSRVFKKVTGESPAGFRRKHQHHEAL